MPLQATSGAASQDAFGGNGVAVVPTYIEDVFSTWLYTGNGSTQTITNGIDLSTKGGLVWLKSRSNAQYHGLWDTLRGPTHALNSALSDGEYTTTSTQDLTGFTSSGFSLGTYWNNSSNQNGATYASWTFRKQPKFFDIVTYTGTGVARTVAHNLGSVPGCIIVKRTDTAGFDWIVYHRSTGNTNRLLLNDTVPAASGTSFWNDTTPTSTVFTVGTNVNGNTNGGTYVAYLFAHDAGGFGLTGSDNVISCGSFTTDGSGAATVSLGYEPQWFLFKRSDDTSNWRILDVMRGGSLTQSSPLIPNLSSAESSFGSFWSPTATGFNIINQAASSTWIYIAIRRGPMKVPTTGTSVYNSVSRTGTDANATISSIGFPPDTLITKNRSGTASPIAAGWLDRLRGLNNFLITDGGSAEDTVQTDILRSWNMNGATLGPDANTSRFNWSANTYMNWFFRRAPSFMDVVCYSGTGSAMTVSHNLAAVPEMMIVKRRNSSTAGSWFVYTSFVGNTGYVVLNATAVPDYWINIWNDTTPTSTQFTVGSYLSQSGGTHVAYLFATCAGVSKVFSYTGNGSSQTINCGFTGGARFVLIRRTDSAGDWYVWDTARGIVAGNDPHLSLNTGTAEVTTDDTIDTDNTGFVVNQVTATNVNVSSATYIGLAVA